MELIGIGKPVTVTIEGQVYSAYIHAINKIDNLVTLVWFQDGNTFTQEVPLNQVLKKDPIELVKLVDNINKVNAISNNSIIKSSNSKPEMKENNTKKVNNDVEQFKSDTKIDSYHKIDQSYSSVLINELKANGKNMPLTNYNIESSYESEDSKSIRSIHSCHCPESEASFNSKICLIETDSCKLNTTNDSFEYKIILSNSSNSPTLSSCKSSIKINNSDRTSVGQLQPVTTQDISNHSILATTSTIQESLKFTLRKREEEIQKKILSTQLLRRKKNKLLTLNLGDPSKDTLAMIRECKQALIFKPLCIGDPIESHAITVCVRKRPLQTAEYMLNDIDIISIPNKDQVIVHELKRKVNLRKYLENHNFRFDYGFDETCDNETVYNFTAKPLISTIFDGGMATCFAYGQTGAGKTFTVGGYYKNGRTNCDNGICALAAKDIFTRLNEMKYNNLKVSASCYEIYNGKVYDLLSDKKLLSVLEDNKHKINIVGLTEKVVSQYDDVLHLIEYSNNIRTSGETSTNKHSSRSHSVFQIILRREHFSKIYGKFSFIDLAGNERGCDSISTNRYEILEAAGINTSLLALKECIRAMGKDKAHLPFRASKLTQVLKDSFVAKNSKTCMIAMIAPGLNSCQYTLNTLRYADRVKELSVRDGIRRNTRINQNILSTTKHNQFACKCITRY